MAKLGVNIDHVATLRQARRGKSPDPVAAAKICEKAGVDSIVVHLREDRRHINEHDVRALRRRVTTRLNLEMSINDEIVAIACRIKPDQATLVPEKRREITTEGGLDVLRQFVPIRRVVRKLQSKGIVVSLFIDPVKAQIARSKETGVTMIELHTGRYAEAKSPAARSRELKKLKTMTRYARNLGLTVNAGHGLNYKNTKAVAGIRGIDELNTGHSIVSHAVFVGLTQAVREMRKLSRGTQR
jgi:pyridoxine 5-phosphate synthase